MKFGPAGFLHDPVAHTYHLNGRRLWSTTDVLSARGIVNYNGAPSDALAAGAEIGHMVEQATVLLDQKKNWSRKYSSVAGYVLAWEVFKREYRYEPVLIETPLYHPDFDYATKPDRFGQSKIGALTVQIKTCKVQRWVALQTAAEEMALGVNGFGPGALTNLTSTPQRIGVELREDGTYKIERFDQPGDFKVFLGLLSACHWEGR